MINIPSPPTLFVGIGIYTSSPSLWKREARRDFII
jgi:hypothetical protein